MKKSKTFISISALFFIALFYLQIGQNVSRGSLDNSFMRVQKAYAEEPSRKICETFECFYTIGYITYSSQYRDCIYSDKGTCIKSECKTSCEMIIPEPE